MGDQPHSIQELKDDVNHNADLPNGIRQYYKLAIDVIEEVRVSEAPAMMPEGYWLACTKCKMQWWLPTTKMTVLTTAFGVFAAVILLVSLYTHPDTYVDKLNKDRHHIASIVIAYLVVVGYLLLFALTMFRLTMIFRKAYALMKIPSNPLDFIGNQENADEQQLADNEFLDDRVKHINPEFLRAWWKLRTHIRDWELTYFFELTNPVLSLEIVFVLSVLLCTIIAVLQDPYDGDLRVFVTDLVSKSNVLMILLLFVVCVAITLLVHLFNLLRPYNEQTAHESWVDRVMLMLKFEAANTYREEDAEANAKYAATMELLSSLKEQMEAVKAAPTLLGIFELIATRIQSIMSAIVVPVTAFAVTFVQGTFTEIGERSGFIPTAEPTMMPTA